MLKAEQPRSLVAFGSARRASSAFTAQPPEGRDGGVPNARLQAPQMLLLAEGRQEMFGPAGTGGIAAEGPEGTPRGMLHGLESHPGSLIHRQYHDS